MGSCAKVVHLLTDYLEGRLPPPVQAELERHLAACAACVAQVATYRSTVGLLHSLSDDDLPIELRLTLRAFLDRATAN